MPLKVLKSAFINHFHNAISIRSRLLLYFILLILLPTSIISITIYYKSTRIITGKINTSLEEKLNMIDANIMQKFEAINDISTEIYLNRDLIRILSSPHPYDKTELISEMSILDKLLENYSVPRITQTLLLPRLYMFNRPEYLMYSFSDKISDISLIEKTKWYMDIPPKAKYTVVGLDQATVSSISIPTIKIVKRLFGLDDTSIPYGGLLTIDVGIDYFNNILVNSKPTIGSSTFIVDAGRSIVVSPDVSMLGKNLGTEKYMDEIFKDPLQPYGSFIEKTRKENLLVSYKKIEPLQWTIVSLTPMHELNGELISFNRVMVVVIMICVILALVMALVLSDNISYPIRKLVKSMSVVQSGNFDIALEYKRNDEFTYLFNTYKKMVHEIKGLIDKLYISEVNKKEAELKSLQAQINPHFLYNTLDSVNWLAMKHKVPDISTMVTSLSDFFRYSLSKGRNIITLAEEKKQVESYLIIQKVRFKDKLDYLMDFPQELLGYLTVKLILQPIVENAILHGIEKRRGKGTVSISAIENDGIIEIMISDDGVGADIDELNTLLEGKSNLHKSYGLQNVNERIKQTFGDEFGIRFSQNEPTGVFVTVRIPAITNLEG